MSLSVLSVAYSLAPVGPDAAGGAEQVLTQLDAALVRAGHRSLVVACGGSECAGTLIPTPAPPPRLSEHAQRQAQTRHHEAILSALEHWPVDLIHMHGIDFHQYLPPPGVPVLVTLHLPPHWYPPEVFQGMRPDTWLHCVSAAQRRTCPPAGNLLPEVPNGVPVEQLDTRVRKRGYAVALGRICPEKGYHYALDAATLAGIPLLLAGELFPYPAHQRYFHDEVAPRLAGPHRCIGRVGLRRKRRLLGAARCLLVPSLAPETSSLVAMEALACGTPVVAFRAGALPEIVEHGVTGFLVDDVREMADAIHAAADLDPEACRSAARQRFSVDAMIQRYFALYEQLAGAGAGAC